MSFGDVATRSGEGECLLAGPRCFADRLSLGVAARLSRYLQVLTQASKMGKETISSQELSDYTHVNSTQIRRDLSGFGKFGKRGVGYNVESLVSQIRKILRTAASTTSRCSARGHLGRPSPRRTSSPTTASGSWRSSTPIREGRARGGQPEVRHIDDLKAVVDEEDIVVGCLAGPRRGGQELADQLVPRGREDHLQLRRDAPAGPARGDRAHLEPAVDLLYALYFYLT
jgi:redox-sensing transcriptional repressor